MIGRKVIVAGPKTKVAFAASLDMKPAQPQREFGGFTATALAHRTPDRQMPESIYSPTHGETA